MDMDAKEYGSLEYFKMKFQDRGNASKADIVIAFMSGMAKHSDGTDDRAIVECLKNGLQAIEETK